PRIAPHAFPTRRSSDLELDAVAVGVLDPGLVVVVGTHLLRPVERNPPGADFRNNMVDVVDLQADVVEADLPGIGRTFPYPVGKKDRKSTRLNSSHVKIS